MRNSWLTRTPLSGLFSELSRSLKQFVREELELVKSELSEKFSCYGRNAASVAIGGAVAYAGLIVLLAGIGFLVGWAFRKANLDPALANFIGLGAVGLVVVLIGAAVVLKGLKAFSTNSLAPERTIETIKQLNGTNLLEHPTPAEKSKEDQAPRRSPDELKEEVLATEEHISATIDEIAYRASPVRLKRRADAEVHTHPYKWSLAALGGGLVTSMLVMRRLHFRKS